MSKYKAIIIDGKKVLRRITALGIASAVAAVCIFNTKLAGIELPSKPILNAENIIDESLPVFGGANAKSSTAGTNLISVGRKALYFLLAFDPTGPRTIMFSHLP